MFINIMYNGRLEAQRALGSKEHILVAYQKEQRNVTDLEGKLSSHMKTMEIENSKLRNANKVSFVCFLYRIHIYELS